MPRIKAGAETIDDKKLSEEIERFIKTEYPITPGWVNGSFDIRDRNIMIEYNKLTRIRGLTGTRAKQILSRLVGRSYKAVDKILSE